MSNPITSQPMTQFVTVLSQSYHCLILEDSHTARPRPSIPHKYLITPYFGSPHMRPYTRASARRIQRLRAPDHVAESCTAQAVGAAEAPDLALQCCSDFALMATPAAPQPCLRKARCTDRQSVGLKSTPFSGSDSVFTTADRCMPLPCC